MLVTGLSISAPLAKNTTTIAKLRCPSGRNLANGLKENVTAEIEEAEVVEEEIGTERESGTENGIGTEIARRQEIGTMLEAVIAPQIVDALVKPSQIDISISGVCILYISFFIYFFYIGKSKLVYKNIQKKNYFYLIFNL